MKLFERWRGRKRFVSQEAFESNLAKQLAMTPATLEQLRGHGVGADSQKRLEYFFYTADRQSAEALSGVFDRRGYSSTVDVSAHSADLFLVNGWTTPMPMMKAVVLEWTRDMTTLGFEHDCEFDGWGASVGDEVESGAPDAQ